MATYSVSYNLGAHVSCNLTLYFHIAGIKFLDKFICDTFLKGVFAVFPNVHSS